MRSFFRYPGGKYKLLKQILIAIGETIGDREYREPFFGGGSVGINVIKEFKPTSVWVNDFDVPLADLWSMVMNQPELLKGAVNEFEPSVDAFFSFKELLSGDTAEIPSVECGFMKLAVHQMSYSGLGTMAGGPIGGRSQSSKYDVGCRWSPKNICKQVDKINALFASTSVRNDICSSEDYLELIEEPGEAFIYLDPPYYDQGQKLYQNGFTHEQHVAMRDALKATSNPWVLSYDDDPEVWELYKGWSNVYAIDGVNYSITATRDEHGNTASVKKTELLITSK